MSLNSAAEHTYTFTREEAQTVNRLETLQVADPSVEDAQHHIPQLMGLVIYLLYICE